MAFLKRLSVLFWASTIVAGPLPLGADDTPTSTPTVTVTGAPLPKITEVFTVTRSIWPSSTTIYIDLNCTQAVYATTPTPTPIATPPAVTPRGQINVRAPFIKRQGSGSSSPTANATTTSTTPSVTPVTVTASPPPPGTTIVYTTSTATQTSVVSHFRYVCGATEAYAYTQDVTTTVTYPYTNYVSVQTAVTTVICPGIGGFPAGNDRVSIMSAATPTAEIAERQAPTVTPFTTATIHLTRTVYTVAVTNITAPVTTTRTECSQLPYDVTVPVPVTRTTYTAVTTIVSYFPCAGRGGTGGLPTATPGTPAPAIDTDENGLVRRQSGSDTSAPVAATPSYTIHRTQYVRTTVLVTASAPYRSVVYACSPTATPTADGV